MRRKEARKNTEEGGLIGHSSISIVIIPQTFVAWLVFATFLEYFSSIGDILIETDLVLSSMA
jgi:hypothetical protein